jgi:hypothetical protein
VFSGLAGFLGLFQPTNLFLILTLQCERFEKCIYLYYYNVFMNLGGGEHSPFIDPEVATVTAVL